MIVRAQACGIDERGRLVVSRVHVLDRVARTSTCPVVHL